MLLTGIVETLINVFNGAILFYVILVSSSYFILALISMNGLAGYLKENAFIEYKLIKSSGLAPALSVIAPAYNEGKNIKENVHSLLNLNYDNYEVIIVNDGSKDNTLEVLIKSYDLEIIEYEYIDKIPTKNIRAVYKSKNPAFYNLIIADKENGGKADALNVGMNISANPYIICIDADCVIHKDALLILAKPLLEKSDRHVIATGGVVRIANSCVITAGGLTEINAPKNLLARIQVLEYLRAFLLARMAWGKLDGLLLISGAFGLFDKDIAIKCGGYNPKTVGEDMELVVRMRRYMLENNLKYAVTYIPNPLCWTEAPESFEILLKQRSRWARGTMETLWIHRIMFLNPKYKILGLLSVPYWFIFEYLAPIVEFTGLIITLFFAFLGILSFQYFFLLFGFVYSFAVMFSILTLLTEEYTYHQYGKAKDFIRLLIAAFVEPVYFHFFTVYAALMGNWEEMRGRKTWGDMERTGFQVAEDKKKKSFPPSI